MADNGNATASGLAAAGRLTGANLVAGAESAQGGVTLRSRDARTGASGPVAFHEATGQEIARAAAAAEEAARELASWDGPRIGGLLRAIAEELEACGDDLVELVDAESGLGAQRVVGERARTCGQLRAFAALVESGEHYEAIIDRADPGASPPRPELRRMLVPIGPVAVFGASNFPLAFGVPGGDTAAALAAGCPVLAKGHPSHPGTSEMTGRAILAAVERCGAPAGAFSLLQGASVEVGSALVLAPEVKAVGFTGSLRGGRALYDLAAGRPEPIPVYAEMGSLNPVFVTAGALAERTAAVAEGLVQSMTMGTGQFCTKPGVVFVPEGDAGERFTHAVADGLRGLAPTPMLNDRIHQALDEQLQRTTTLPGVEVVVGGGPGDGGGSTMSPTLLRCDLRTFASTEALRQEHFGPVTVLVATPPDGMIEAARALEGTLTATVQGTEAEAAEVAPLAAALRERTGRLIWNGYPTGVAVVAAQHHGGPYPATTSSGHTSVGVTGIRRFQRPVAYQDSPDALLPPPLRDANPLGIPRLVDGQRTAADAGSPTDG